MHKMNSTAARLNDRNLEPELAHCGMEIAPNPLRLRAACLLIYAGLLMSLGTMIASAH